MLQAEMMIKICNKTMKTKKLSFRNVIKIMVAYLVLPKKSSALVQGTIALRLTVSVSSWASVAIPIGALAPTAKIASRLRDLQKPCDAEMNSSKIA